MTFTIEEPERQMILLALATLTLERPGFDFCNSIIADKLQGTEMYREFKKLNADKFEGSPP